MTPVTPPPIPKAKGSLPLLGHVIPLMRDPLAFTASLRTAYGPLVEITLPGTPTVVVQDPELIHAMLKNNTLDKGKFFEAMGEILGGDSVVTAAGQGHRRKRRQLQPAFATPEIKRYVDIMRDEVTTTVDAWQSGQTLDVREAMVELSLNMLAKTVFGGSLQGETFRQLRRDLSIVMTGVGARIMLPTWAAKVPLPFNRRFDRAREGVRATVGRAVDELRASGHDTGDMLSLLLHATDSETGEPLTAHEISSEIITLAVAGTETTASVLSWVLYELSRNPAIEAGVLDELHQVVGERPIAFGDVMRLPYLRRVIDEALRLHHTGFLVTRRTTTETRLGEWILPAGVELAYCQHAWHRDPELFPDPLRFDPDRWLEATQPSPSSGYIPFGTGAHKCIGDRFALTEMITAIATIVRRVRLELPDGQTVRPVARATVRPQTLRMTVQPRQATTVPLVA
ncbi:cytochrome P450 [Streptomyces sp. NPDC058385]|uniref:cytochrome P450 n=1 Tax=Streptomyces sp. NPDC058385 TaxID=3346473 RepID=UPI003665AEFA